VRSKDKGASLADVVTDVANNPDPVGRDALDALTIVRITLFPNVNMFGLLLCGWKDVQR
jgi:hypothetical protein